MIIPDRATAERIGHRAVELRQAESYRVFQYEQRSSRLTLFGAVLMQPDGSEREVRQA